MLDVKTVRRSAFLIWLVAIGIMIALPLLGHNAKGATRWVEGVGQVLLDDAGRPDRMVGICADITDRKQLEEDRAQLLRREVSAANAVIT